MTDLLVTITGTETMRDLHLALEDMRLRRLDHDFRIGTDRRNSLEATVSALCDAITDKATQRNRDIIEAARDQGMGA